MNTNYKVETNINGWQRVIIDFTVKSKPRIDEQDFQFSVWLKYKDKDELFLYEPRIDKK